MSSIVVWGTSGLSIIYYIIYMWNAAYSTLRIWTCGLQIYFLGEKKTFKCFMHHSKLQVCLKSYLYQSTI